MIVLDTSVLVDALTGVKGMGRDLVERFTAGDRLVLPAVALYEWLRGPRTEDELELQRSLFPEDEILLFGPQEAEQAAKLYKLVKRARGREIDLMISSHAIVHGARLWTLNRKDFVDIPGIELLG